MVSCFMLPPMKHKEHTLLGKNYTCSRGNHVLAYVVMRSSIMLARNTECNS